MAKKEMPSKRLQSDLGQTVPILGFCKPYQIHEKERKKRDWPWSTSMSIAQAREMEEKNQKRQVPSLRRTKSRNCWAFVGSFQYSIGFEENERSSLRATWAFMGQRELMAQ